MLFRSKKTVCFVKDSWRFDHADIKPEHEVYERLHKYSVKNIPTCLGGENVGEGTSGLQRTRLEHPSNSLRQRDHHDRVHYRLFIKEVLRPLTDFIDFQDLVVLMTHALCGE